jgi:hypothetical protein
MTSSSLRWCVWVLASCAALAGCAPSTNVSVATSTPSQYSHVYLTVQEVWFNTSSTATPEDTTWQKFPLTTPITLDLASLTGGALGQIATALKVPAGTYSQVRLIPVDPGAALTSSAEAAGAQSNAEVVFADTTVSPQSLPLELLNPEKGIGIQTSITLKADISAAAGNLTGAMTGTTSNCTPTTDPTTGETVPCPTTTTSTTTTSTTTTPTTTTPTTTTATTVSLVVTLDALHDLVQFHYGGQNGTGPQTGVLLSPHTATYDTSLTGTISGTLDTTNISSSTGDIFVTAETLSADGTRHTAVSTVHVPSSGGNFVLYPLSIGSSTNGSTPSISSSSSTNYDLVIHGPGIATVVIKSVPVSAGAPSSTNVTSVGTVTLRGASSFSLNLAASSQAAPPGALVSFYQTLASGEAPYLIEATPMDPFSLTLFASDSLSEGTVDSGTYVSGGSVTLTPVTPVEGAGNYALSAQAPLFADGPLTTLVGSSTTLATPPPLIPAAGSLSTLSLTVSAATPGKYDQGELIVSHDGAVVQTVAIDTALTQNGGQNIVIGGLPGGASSSVYYLSTRAWKSSGGDPAGTLQRQSFVTPVDLRSGSVSGLTLTVN